LEIGSSVVNATGIETDDIEVSRCIVVGIWSCTDYGLGVLSPLKDLKVVSVD
jgi:hypothetical protein